MPTSEVERSVYLQTPRVVKCPTPQCPGWITLDSTRHQTEPCRYCRIGVDTLRFLLSRVAADNKTLPPQVHDEFNRLMLTMAGAWGQNVYLRPSTATLVDLKSGTRGVTVEYNPQLGDAGEDGAAPLVGVILHKLLHFEAHLGQKLPQLTVKSGSKDKETLAPLLSYLLTVGDHAWLMSRLQALSPDIHAAQSRWGLDVAQMLTGSESMFNRYLSERNLTKLVALLEDAEDAKAFRTGVMDILASLTAQILAPEKEDQRRTYLAIQLANLRLLNPDSYESYVGMLSKKELANLRDAQPLAEKLYSELEDSPISHPQSAKPRGSEGTGATTVDHGQFTRAMEAGVKALGLANWFEIKG
ncbi:MAG: hypothetical protein ABIQ44_05680 [Chloroflexia bacterium]